VVDVLASGAGVHGIVWFTSAAKAAIHRRTFVARLKPRPFKALLLDWRQSPLGMVCRAAVPFFSRSCLGNKKRGPLGSRCFCFYFYYSNWLRGGGTGLLGLFCFRDHGVRGDWVGLGG
jgi:hypothetical protein